MLSKQSFRKTGTLQTIVSILSVLRQPVVRNTAENIFWIALEADLAGGTRFETLRAGGVSCRPHAKNRWNEKGRQDVRFASDRILRQSGDRQVHHLPEYASGPRRSWAENSHRRLTPRGSLPSMTLDRRAGKSPRWLILTMGHTKQENRQTRATAVSVPGWKR